MKASRIFLAVYFIIGALMNAQAALNAFPTANTGKLQLTKQEFLKRFETKKPTCVKDGVATKFFNDAYASKYGNNKVPCRKKWVTIIKLNDLDQATQKELLGYK